VDFDAADGFGHEERVRFDLADIARVEITVHQWEGGPGATGRMGAGG
jgi:hypothetical protein